MPFEFISLIVGLFSFLLWFPFWNVPYYTDSAAIAYLADNMKRGKLPYRDFFAYTPMAGLGLYYIARRFFRDGKLFLNIFNILWQTVGAIGTAWIGYELSGSAAGLCAGIIYVLLATSVRIEGPICNFEAMTLPPVVLAFLLLLLFPSELGAIFICGLLLCLSSLIKQVSLVYAIPLFGLTVFRSGAEAGAIFIVGFALPHLSIILYYWRKNGAIAYLADNWLFFIPSLIGGNKNSRYSPTSQKGISTDPQEIWRKLRFNSECMLPWLILTPGGIALGLSSEYGAEWLTVAVGLILAVCLLTVRGTFWPHYWQNLILWIALLAGFGFAGLVAVTEFS